MWTNLGFIIVILLGIITVFCMTRSIKYFSKDYHEECFMCKKTSCSEECIYFKGGVK